MTIDIHPLLQDVGRMYPELTHAHEKFYDLMLTINRNLHDPSVDLSQADRADLLWFVKQYVDSFDDLRKEANKLKGQLDNIIGTVAVKQAAATNDISGNMTIRGVLATVTPKLDLQADIPSPTQHPTEYALVLKKLGLTGEGSEEAIRRGVLRLHFPAVSAWCTENTENAKALPPGLTAGKHAAKYGSRCVRTKRISIGDYLACIPDADTEVNTLDPNKLSMDVPYNAEM